MLEGAKVELNDTDGSKVGNGYTRCNVIYEFTVIIFVVSLGLCFDIISYS